MYSVFFQVLCDSMIYDFGRGEELPWFDATAQKGWSHGGTNLYKGQSVSMATGTFLKGVLNPKRIFGG